MSDPLQDAKEQVKLCKAMDHYGIVARRLDALVTKHEALSERVKKLEGVLRGFWPCWPDECVRSSGQLCINCQHRKEYGL